MKKNRKIVFTGGGTAGHVTPNLAIYELLKEEGWEASYIGSKNGIEHSMISAIGLPYYAVHSGKLRRYFSWKNFIDPFKVLVGVIQSYCILRKIKPCVIFSKGGFVALPVVIGAYLNRVPIIAHESDLTPGLANRLCFPFVDKICVTFSEAKKHFKQQSKIEVTGTPIRAELFHGSQKKGLQLSGLTEEKPILLIVGGSLGSDGLNRLIRDNITTLLNKYQLIHLCGKGKIAKELLQQPSYYQLEYANDELPHFLAASDLVVSRSGSNALHEILALAKPHILIPLSRKVSRGDQIHNAKYYEKLGISTVLDDDLLSADQLLNAVETVLSKKEILIKKMKHLDISSATQKIVKIINDTALDKTVKD